MLWSDENQNVEGGEGMNGLLPLSFLLFVYSFSSSLLL